MIKRILKAVGVFSLLLLFLVPLANLCGSVDKAKQKEAVFVLPQLAKQISLFKGECGRYPIEAEGLSVIHDALSVCPKFSGSIDKRFQLDPWSRPYVYELKDDGTAFDLVSYGKDGKPGGSGYDKDIRWSELGGDR